MIILKIKQKGMYLEIPGITPFRTPAEVDITHVSIPLVTSNLKAYDILNYEIVSDTKGQEKKYTEKDFVEKEKTDEQKKRIDNLEKLLERLIKKIPSSTPVNEEQINKKLDVIEELIHSKSTEKIFVQETTQEKTRKEPKIDEEIFIPDIDIGKMKIGGGSSKITIKQNKSDIDSSADLLSKIGK